MIGEEPKEESKGVEFTHVLGTITGWIVCNKQPSFYHRIVYLGHCKQDGDMFAAYINDGYVNIYKGNLNNGTY